MNFKKYLSEANSENLTGDELVDAFIVFMNNQKRFERGGTSKHPYITDQSWIEKDREAIRIDLVVSGVYGYGEPYIDILYDGIRNKKQVRYYSIKDIKTKVKSKINRLIKELG